MICSSKMLYHHNGSEFIATTFNEGHKKAIHEDNVLSSFY